MSEMKLEDDLERGKSYRLCAEALARSVNARRALAKAQEFFREAAEAFPLVTADSHDEFVAELMRRVSGVSALLTELRDSEQEKGYALLVASRLGINTECFVRREAV